MMMLSAKNVLLLGVAKGTANDDRSECGDEGYSEDHVGEMVGSKALSRCVLDDR